MLQTYIQPRLYMTQVVSMEVCLPVDEVDGMCLQLLSAMQICQDKNFGDVVNQEARAECLLAHHLQTLQGVLKTNRIKMN